MLLLDEPLSALDAKVRVQLREEIRRIQLETGTTTVQTIHFLGSLTRIDTLITDETVVRGNAGKPLQVAVQMPANEIPAGFHPGIEVTLTPRPVAALAV